MQVITYQRPLYSSNFHLFKPACYANPDAESKLAE